MAFAITGCFQIRHLNYNERCDLYTYRDEPIRLPDRRLITMTNIDTFLIRAQSYYLLQAQLKENDLWLSSADRLLVQQYDSMIVCMLRKNYEQAVEYAKKLKRNYNDMTFFSDIDFVLGYAWIRLEKGDSARAAFTKFLSYAGQKYPGRFRGIYRTPAAEEQFCVERQVAKKYLNGDSFPSLSLLRIAPNFYYQSLSPGYFYNPDDFKRSTRWIFSGVGWETTTNLNFIQTSIAYRLHNRLGLFMGIKYHKSLQIYYVTMPWQASWAQNRRWGIKLTPALFWGYSNQMSHSRLIPGLGFSMGYHIHPRYYVGFSTSITFVPSTEWKPYFESQQWSFSINAHLIKNLSGSLVFMPHAIITGITLNNTILGYNWKEKQMYLSLFIF